MKQKMRQCPQGCAYWAREADMQLHLSHSHHGAVTQRANKSDNGVQPSSPWRASGSGQDGERAGVRLVFRTWKYVGGSRVYARDYGLRAWPLYVVA